MQSAKRVDITRLTYCKKCNLPIELVGGCTCKGVRDCPSCGERVSTRFFDHEHDMCDDCVLEKERLWT